MQRASPRFQLQQQGWEEDVFQIPDQTKRALSSNSPPERQKLCFCLYLSKIGIVPLLKKKKTEKKLSFDSIHISTAQLFLTQPCMWTGFSTEKMPNFRLKLAGALSLPYCNGPFQRRNLRLLHKPRMNWNVAQCNTAPMWLVKKMTRNIKWLMFLVTIVFDIKCFHFHIYYWEWERGGEGGMMFHFSGKNVLPREIPQGHRAVGTEIS